MFGPLGGPELLLVFVIALIVFGPRKLPEIGKSLGKMIGEFRRASNDLKRTIEDEVEAERLRELASGYPGGPTPRPPAASAPEAHTPDTSSPTATTTGGPDAADTAADSASGATPSSDPVPPTDHP